MNWRQRRRARNDHRMESALLGEIHRGSHSVTEMWQATGYNVGHIYAALHRLVNEGLVEGIWEDRSATHPRRRFYHLTTGQRS